MIKEAFNTAKTIKNAFDKIEQLNDDIQHLQALGEATTKSMELTQVAIKLQQMIISLQKDLRALETENRELEDLVSQLSKFEIEKDQYSPFQFTTGAFVYRSNEGITNANGEVVFHYLCANCYNQGKKSILQPSPVEGYFEMLCCHHCHAKIQMKRIETDNTVIFTRSRSRRWTDGY